MISTELVTLEIRYGTSLYPDVSGLHVGARQLSCKRGASFGKRTYTVYNSNNGNKSSKLAQATTPTESQVISV